MAKLRAFLVALTIMAMAVAPLVVPMIGAGSANNSQAYAATAGAPTADNDDDDDDDDNDDDDDDNDDDDDDNDNSDDNGNSNSNSNDNDSDDNDNDAGLPVAPPSSSGSQQQAAPPPAACSTPGQEMTFQSSDGRITVKVFGSMTQSVKFSIRLPIDPASVPPAPGPMVDSLLFQLIAETCDGSPIPVLPAEVNLGVHYADADAAGLNEANFTLSRLDTSANQWRAVAKQAADPPSNLTSATVTEMGFYVLHQRS
jgi:hypothetical protein